MYNNLDEVLPKFVILQSSTALNRFDFNIALLLGKKHEIFPSSAQENNK